MSGNLEQRGKEPWSFQGSPLVSTAVNSMTLRLTLVLGSGTAKIFQPYLGLVLIS